MHKLSTGEAGNGTVTEEQSTKSPISCLKKKHKAAIPLSATAFVITGWCLSMTCLFATQRFPLHTSWFAAARQI
jgi:hypothetical protein